MDEMDNFIDIDSDCDNDVYDALLQDRVIFLAQDITPEYATSLVAKILLLDKQCDTEEITVYINSCGGDLIGLISLYDIFQSVKSPIKTVAIGEASSAAAILLASGSKGLRFAYPNARIMLHNLQLSGLSGSQSELEKEGKRTKKLNDILMRIIAQHCNQSLRKVTKNCRTDFFMNATEALKYGLIDEIIPYQKNIPALKK